MIQLRRLRVGAIRHARAKDGVFILELDDAGGGGGEVRVGGAEEGLGEVAEIWVWFVGGEGVGGAAGGAGRAGVEFFEEVDWVDGFGEEALRVEAGEGVAAEGVERGAEGEDVGAEVVEGVGGVGFLDGVFIV